MTKRFSTFLLLFLSLSVWVNAQNVETSADVMELIRAVNRQWQKSHPEPGNHFWDNAAYHTGNMAAYAVTGESEFLDYSKKWAEHNKWSGAKGQDPSLWKYATYGEGDNHVLFGDHQTCFQTYCDLYNLSPSREKIDRAREVMEYQMSTPANDYWWWADGLYMVMPVMTKLYNITGNEKYLDKMYEYWQYANSIMFDPESNLYFRDAKYVYPAHKTASGKKDFWARGDGWVLAALAKVIDDLPASYPRRKEYISRFKDMADAIVAAQQPEGYWTRSILDPGQAPGPETSGTAFFTFALLKGINDGIIPAEKYLPSALKGWNYLRNTALQPDFTVGYVQPIGEKAIPRQVVNASSTSNFGTGAFLLAASEMAKYLMAKESTESPLTFVINTKKRSGKISPTMYGLFFEDINYGADGGLYAEKIKNRSFEFQNPLMGWETSGKIEVRDDGPFNANPHYLRLSPSGHTDKHTAIENLGFFGVTVEKGKKYNFSVWARVPDGGKSKIKVELMDPANNFEGQQVAAKEITVEGSQWKRYSIELSPSATLEKGRLRIFLRKPENTVDLEHISLFPDEKYSPELWMLRKDLVEKLAGLQPGVFRFPGGCIVEGTDLATRYQWKNTVGQVENRPNNENRWQYTFTNRFFPDYYQSGGLGFYEYFLLSEALGAAPLPVINVGLSCQYQNRDEKFHVPVDQLEPYIQDALDLIEFANGSTDSKWGKLRAEMGHPEPFGLKYLAVGNEQWGPEYVTRLEPFVKAIRKAYPEIKIVGSSGPDSEGKKFDFLWPEMTKLKVDLVDEHFYRPEKWFEAQADRYDKYDRKGPKVFAGEYACHGKGIKRNHFNAALLEAAFMTGLERNADVVEMATYAPLFAHVEGWQWRPDLIWFDNLRSMPTASYYVQQLYAKNKGTEVVPLTMDKKPVAGKEGQENLFATAAFDEPTGDYIVKIVNNGIGDKSLNLDFSSLKGKKFSSMRRTSLHADRGAENTLDRQDRVVPQESVVEFSPANVVNVMVPAKTFVVVRLNPAN